MPCLHMRPPRCQACICMHPDAMLAYACTRCHACICVHPNAKLVYACTPMPCLHMHAQDAMLAYACTQMPCLYMHAPRCHACICMHPDAMLAYACTSCHACICLHEMQGVGDLCCMTRQMRERTLLHTHMAAQQLPALYGLCLPPQGVQAPCTLWTHPQCTLWTQCAPQCTPPMHPVDTICSALMPYAHEHATRI